MDGAFHAPRVRIADPIERIADAAKRLGLNVWTLRSRAETLGLTSGRAAGRPRKGEVAGLRRSEWNLCGGEWTRGPKARVVRSAVADGKKPRWSSSDEAELALQWGVMEPADLCRRLGRSWRGIIDKAGKMGLPSGLPRGWVSITEASRVIGMPRCVLVKALDRNGIEVRPHPCPIIHASSRKRTAMQTGIRSSHMCVDLFLAQDAIAREVRETEVVRAAAIARGLVPQTLRTWLREAMALPESAVRGAPVRVRTEIIDRVVNARRAEIAKGASDGRR